MTTENTHLPETVSEPENQAPKRDAYKRAVDRILVKLATSVEADSLQPYLDDNEVGSHDLSLDKSGNLLAVAIDPKASFKNSSYIPCPQNLLTISPSGEYSLETGAKYAGCAVMIGHKRLRQMARDRLARHELFITVDYATGAFLYEETGSPAVAAIRTANMPKVYAALREIFPHTRIVACLNFESNKHKMRKKTADEINQAGGIAIVPRLSLKERLNGLISFNDLAMFHQNRDRVMETILNLIQYPQDYQQGQTAEKEAAKAAGKRKNQSAKAAKKKIRSLKNVSSKTKLSRKPSACRQEVRL